MRRPARLALPRPSAARRARLWLSYQRYGLLILAATTAVVAAVACFTPGWIAVLVAAIAIAPVRFAGHVLGSWPRKLRATRFAEQRIRSGRFAPRQVRPLCGDPCFRVVACEILARAGVGPGERRALIAEYRRDAGTRDVLLLVDRAAGVVVRTCAASTPARCRSSR